MLTDLLLSITGKRSRSFFFFFNDTATTEIYTLSLHDALPISSTSGVMLIFRDRSPRPARNSPRPSPSSRSPARCPRSEEHTSELQSPCNLVCRLLLEKKKKRHLARSAPPPTDNQMTAPHAPLD